MEEDIKQLLTDLTDELSKCAYNPQRVALVRRARIALAHQALDEVAAENQRMGLYG